MGTSLQGVNGTGGRVEKLPTERVGGAEATSCPLGLRTVALLLFGWKTAPNHKQGRDGIWGVFEKEACMQGCMRGS